MREDLQRADLTPSEHLDTAIPEGSPTGDFCATRAHRCPSFCFWFRLEQASSLVRKALAGTLAAALLSPPLSPEGLHQIEVGELVQIHKGVEHCQVQLFPGRTGTKSLTGRSLGRWERTGLWGGCAASLASQLPLQRMKVLAWAIAGLARGQGRSEHTLARTAGCHDPALVALHKNDPHNARCPRTIPHTSDVHRWSPST